MARTVVSVTRGGGDTLEKRVLGRLKDRFDRLGWSYSTLSEKADVEYNMLYSLMTGRRTLTLKYVEKIAGAMDYSIPELFAAERQRDLVGLRRYVGTAMTETLNMIDRLIQDQEGSGHEYRKQQVKTLAKRLAQEEREAIARGEPEVSDEEFDAWIEAHLAQGDLEPGFPER